MTALAASSVGFDDEIPVEQRSPEEVLDWAYRSYGRVAIVASFQVESSVLIHMASQRVERPDVITLDTGRLPEETHEVIDRMLRRYSIRLHVEAPDASEVAELVSDGGPNRFRRSPADRHLCCEVRKVRPLKRALAGYDAWITGLRRDQSASRRLTPVVQMDPAHGDIVKLAPLAAWSRDQVWDYARRHQLELHPLYARSYRSIGCAPCTRAVGPDEDERAGRWWWERDATKECGLHTVDGRLVRAEAATSRG
jgi:thioredoxin-dependent adenylylsulfate APS reductase